MSMFSNCKVSFKYSNFLFMKPQLLSNRCSVKKSLYHSSMLNVIKNVQNKNKINVSVKNFTRAPKKYFTKKKNFSYDLVTPGKVGIKRNIPNFITKPIYAETGVDLESELKVLNIDSLKCMRQSCSLAKTVLDEVGRNIKVDVTTDELDAIAHTLCIKLGAYPSPLNYRGFPKSICTSVNNVACHGIPDNRKLKDGDIISVDVSVFYNGFHGDCAAAYCVGNVDSAGRKIVETAFLCLQAGIKICHHGQDFCMIGKTISKLAKDNGCSVIPAFCGHGIGSTFHCPPSISHYDNNDEGKMINGMIFTIEPAICDGEPDIIILEDGWTAVTEDHSRSAQFEHTILITEKGAEILTVPGVFQAE